MNKRSKHIETNTHFIRENVEARTIFTSTGAMAANNQIKVFPFTAIEQLRSNPVGYSNTQIFAERPGKIPVGYYKIEEN